MWIPLVNGQQRELVPLSTWDNLGCRCIAYALEPLLVKPGLDVLLSQPSLAQYAGWSHQVILDVSHLQKKHSGDVVITSPFDGAKIQVTAAQLSALIASLKPDVVIDTEPSRLGLGPTNFVSDKPLHMATKGEVFSGTSVFNITDPIYRTSTEVLQHGCRCEACTLGLTRSYFFHLWSHVPGLCVRFLVQHNATVFFDCNSL